MNLLLTGLLVLGVGALSAFVFHRGGAGEWLGATAAVAAGAAFLAVALQTLSAAETTSWQMGIVGPLGAAFALRLDALASVFLIPLAIVGPACALYGVAYLKRHGHGRANGAAIALYDLLLLSMVLVVTANDLVLLIVAWELMTLCSWALIISDHGQIETRTAGLQYLIAGHLATACLILLVLFLSAGSGSLGVAAQTGRAPVAAGLLFVLALVGFGTKAGIVPFHVWLPDAHPAAPSHVSALMSAVVVTMGFYGLARFLPLLGPAQVWWAYVLIALGSAGAVGGIAFALAQRDVKRILAYSTVENAGIITVAMGVGVFGAALEQPGLAAVGWAAALLHVWNHAFAKALLFLGFGAVAQGAGDRSLEAHGGMLRRWPLPGSLLILGCAAIAALPGLNVFTSEWLLFRGLLAGILVLQDAPRIALVCAFALLAFVSGLAVACFARIAGVCLLGSPRTATAATAPPPPVAMWLPVLFLASICVVMGAVPHAFARALPGAVLSDVTIAAADRVQVALRPLMLLPPLLFAGVTVVLGFRAIAARRTGHTRAPTWGCAFPATTPDMQYTASSFSQPLTRMFQPVLRTQIDHGVVRARSIGPRSISWSSTTDDRLLRGLYRPVFTLVSRFGIHVRAYHHPRVSRGLLYIVLTLIVLLGLLFLPMVRS